MSATFRENLDRLLETLPLENRDTVKRFCFDLHRETKGMRAQVEDLTTQIATLRQEATRHQSIVNEERLRATSAHDALKQAQAKINLLTPPPEPPVNRSFYRLLTDAVKAGQQQTEKNPAFEKWVINQVGITIEQAEDYSLIAAYFAEKDVKETDPAEILQGVESLIAILHRLKIAVVRTVQKREVGEEPRQNA